MSTGYILASIFIITIVTGITRGLPYLIFGRRKIPRIIVYIGNVFPASIMIVLVCYCLRNIDLKSYPYGFKELASVLVVAVLHIWKKNTILSISLGTIFYVILIRLPF